MLVTTLVMPTSPRWRSSNASSSPEGMGNENMVPLGKMGLGQPPEPESKPLRLMISFLGFALRRPAFSCAVRLSDEVRAIQSSGVFADLPGREHRR